MATPFGIDQVTVQEPLVQAAVKEPLPQAAVKEPLQQAAVKEPLANNVDSCVLERDWKVRLPPLASTR